MGIKTPRANRLNTVPILCNWAQILLNPSVPSAHVNFFLAYVTLMLEMPTLAKVLKPKRKIRIITTCLIPPGLDLKATPKLSLM